MSNWAPSVLFLYVVMEDVPQGLDDADGEADILGDDLGLAAQLASEP